MPRLSDFVASSFISNGNHRTQQRTLISNVKTISRQQFAGRICARPERVVTFPPGSASSLWWRVNVRWRASSVIFRYAMIAPHVTCSFMTSLLLNVNCVRFGICNVLFVRRWTSHTYWKRKHHITNFKLSSLRFENKRLNYRLCNEFEQPLNRDVCGRCRMSTDPPSQLP